MFFGKVHLVTIQESVGTRCNQVFGRRRSGGILITVAYIPLEQLLRTPPPPFLPLLDLQQLCA